MTLGDVIKSYRQSHGLSMEAFSKASGLSKAYIGILEKNVNPTTGKPVVPSIVTYKAASLAMGMDMQKLIELVDSDSPVSMEAIDPLDWDCAAQEIIDDINTKLEYCKNQLLKLADPMSHLSQETIDMLLQHFQEIVDLYHLAAEKETEAMEEAMRNAEQNIPRQEPPAGEG